MITQLDLLPSLQPSQDWIRMRLIDGLINSLMWGKVRKGAALRDARRRGESPGRPWKARRRDQGQLSYVGSATGCQMKGLPLPCSPSTEYLYETPGLSPSCAVRVHHHKS
jgi:hypothetical protein